MWRRWRCVPPWLDGTDGRVLLANFRKMRSATSGCSTGVSGFTTPTPESLLALASGFFAPEFGGDDDMVAVFGVGEAVELLVESTEKADPKTSPPADAAFFEAESDLKGILAVGVDGGGEDGEAGGCRSAESPPPRRPSNLSVTGAARTRSVCGVDGAAAAEPDEVDRAEGAGSGGAGAGG